jgi:hypothetical protein
MNELEINKIAELHDRAAAYGYDDGLEIFEVQYYNKYDGVEELIIAAVMRDNIKELVEGMLKESTGAHLLDSGGAYGRNWERNQTINFEETPTAYIFDGDSLTPGEKIIPIVSLYHWMTTRFLLDGYCNDFNNMEVNDWDGCYGVSKDGLEWLEFEGFVMNDWDNSYNYDNDLSQDIHFCRLDHEELGTYYLIQIHGGCDIRGGYTDAKLFKAVDDDYITISGNAMAVIGDKIMADNMYNGYNLTDENGDDVLYRDGMKIEVWLMEF